MKVQANIFFCLGLVLLLASCSADKASVPESPRLPNILILYADDMGYGDLAIQNPDSKIPTPHLDQLAQEGMRFTDGHSSSGICTPSRYALLTGRHHWRKFHGITRGFDDCIIDPDQLTLPEMLQTKGYHTAQIGKWHLGMGWEALRHQNIAPIQEKGKKAFTPDAFDWSQPIPNGPLAHGFDYSFTDCVINFPPYTWIENDRVVTAPTIMMDTELWKPIKEGAWECRPGPMAEGWDPYENIPTLTRKAVEYIQQQSQTDQPFFLYFAFPSPHAPIIPNDEFDGKSQAGAYGDFMVETDDAVGRILAALEVSGQAKHTLVVFSADNGPEGYAYARDQKYDHWSSAPFRGLKRDIYEGGHHVPFIIKWPSVIPAGSVSDQLVSQIDLMATCAALVKYDLPNNQAEDSHNLLPLLQGVDEPVRDAHVHNTFKGQYAIRQGEWVLVNAIQPPRKMRMNPGLQESEVKRGYADLRQQQAELYHLKQDIGQRKNLAEQYPERVADMTKLLKQIREQGHSAPRLNQTPN